MSSHGFHPGSGGAGEERKDEGQRSGQQQEEAKSESIVRSATQQQPVPVPRPPPHPVQTQLNQAQSLLRNPGQPVAPPVMPSQPPTETVKPYVDTLAKSSTMFTTRPLAPAPAPTISAVPKITAGHVTVMETSIPSVTGLPAQQVTAITTALSLPTPSTIHLASMMKGIQAPSTQVPNHPYPSHVPRGIAAAAAISIPKAGATTAILRPHTQTIGGATGSTTTVQSVLSAPIIPHFQHTQRYSPAPVPVSTTIHSCSAQGISRSSSPAVTTAAAQSEIHRSTHHLPPTLGMSLQPRPLPTPQPQPHLQPQTQHQALAQVPTLLQSQSQTPPQVTHTPPIQLPSPTQFVPPIRQQLQPDLALRTIPLSQHMPKYVPSVTLPGNIPKPIISATPNVTSMPTTQPPQQTVVTVPVVSSVSTTSGPPHTMSVTSMPSVLTSAPIQLGSMLAAVRTTPAISAGNVTSAQSTTQSTPATAQSIPVAKVYPRQQLPHSPRSQPEYEAHQPSSIYLPLAATHRGSPNPVAAAAASVAAAVSLAQTAASTDSRSERPIQALPQTAPYPGIPYYYHHDPTALASYHAMSPYALTSIAAGAVRPIGFNPLPVSSAPQGTQNMAAAAVAAAAHAATVGAAPVRIGPMNLMPVDQRHCMATVPGTATTATTSEAMDTSVTATSMYPSGVLASANTTAGNLPNPSASPRPSILRKRTNEGVRKPVVNTGSQPDSPKTDSSQSTLSATSSPKPSDILNLSQHSTEINITENSTSVLSSVVNEIKIKREPLTPSPTEGSLQINTTASLVPSIASTVVTETVGASPRKKPRKQQHVVATEDHDMMESNSTDEADENEQKPPKMSKKSDKTKEDSKKTARDVKYIQYLKRPYKNLIDSYRQSWTPAHNHFQKYGEVKVKEDKKPSIQEIAGQKGVVQKASGWKIQHIASQLDDLAHSEQDVFAKMKEIKEGIGPCKENSVNSDDEMSQVAELVQGNIQRCKLAMEQMSEARHSMIKLLDHKQKVVSLLNKHTNKRSSKKKSSNSNT